MIVVKDVIDTGRKLTRSASTIASRFAIPSCIDFRSVISMCMESAIASVRIMIGALPDIGVRFTPE